MKVSCQEFGTRILSHGLEFNSLLNTCEAHSSYFRTNKRSKFIKDKGISKQLKVQKRQRKQYLNAVNITGGNRKGKGGTLWPDRGEGGDDWQHTCSTLEETASGQVRRMSVAKLGPEQHSFKTKQETGGEYGIIGENMWTHSMSSDWKSRKCNRRLKRRRCWGANGPVVHHRWAHCLVSAQSLDPRLLYFPSFHLGRFVTFSWNHLPPCRFKPKREIPTFTEFRSKKKSWDLPFWTMQN